MFLQPTFVLASILALQCYANPTDLELHPTVEEKTFDCTNALSLVTSYMGIGYNLLEGYPGGEPRRGGKDPGLLDTRHIYKLSCGKRKAYYNGEAMGLPAQVRYKERKSCVQKSYSHTYSGEKSLQRKFDAFFEVSAGADLDIFTARFSSSIGFTEESQRVEKRKMVTVESYKVCNYGEIRYVTTGSQNSVTDEFKFAVMRLPKHYNKHSKRKYKKFIDDWGTHIITEAEVGTRNVERSSYTHVELLDIAKKGGKLDLSAEAGITKGGYGFSTKAGVKLEDAAEFLTRSDTEKKREEKWDLGTRDHPIILHMELQLITEALDSRLFVIDAEEEVEMQNIGLDKKRRNLFQALKDYPTIAGFDEDPIIQQLVWPDDYAFTLPKPARGGCPRGWRKGAIIQYTLPGNRYSPRIGAYLEGQFARTHARLEYCTRLLSGKTYGVEWPKGTYCIAKHGSYCPKKFRKGFIRWDDSDRNSKHKTRRTGSTPAGNSKNCNTVIDYCCREDSPTKKAIELPTSQRFVLYRHGNRCQQVKGTRVKSLFITLRNERRNNVDTCRLPAPGKCINKSISVHLCHYTPLRQQ